MLNRVKTSNRPQQNLPVFGISQSEFDRRTKVVSVEGELDLSTAPRLKWMLVDSIDAGHSCLVVDLSLATFVDSTALGVLVGVKRRLGEDSRLAIVCARPNVLKIFEFAGVDGAFAIFPTLEEALASTQESEARVG